VTVSGSPLVLTAGSLLNEIDFPPRSGNNVLAHSSDPIEFIFSAPLVSVGAYFTYTSPLSLSTFTPGNVLIETKTSSGSSNLGLQELISFGGPVANIGFLRITGAPGGGSFTMDDLELEVVPEPRLALPLVFVGIAGLLLRWQNRSASR
jgi:hypothetical protein